MKLQTESLIVSILIILAGIAALEIGFSSSILEILTGVFASNFLKLGDLSWIEFLSNLGLLGLMFFAGLETDPELVRKNLLKSLFIGFCSYFFPLVSIFYVTHYVLGYPFEASLLIGIALSTTSLALVYPLLKEKRMLQLPAGQVLLAGAMIVDISSMLTMSFLFEGINVYNFLFSVALILLLIKLPKWGEELFERYAGNQIEFRTRFIIVILIALGFLSETVHINEAVLAFTTGIFFAEFFRKDSLTEKKNKSHYFWLSCSVFLLQGRIYGKTFRNLFESCFPVTSSRNNCFCNQVYWNGICNDKLLQGNCLQTCRTLFQHEIDFWNCCFTLRTESRNN